MPSWAQNETPNAVQIEVLIFAYADGGKGSELASTGSSERAYDLYALGDTGDGWFRVIPASQQKLAGASGVLNRSARTELLLHTGWRQPSRDPRRIVLRSEQSLRIQQAATGLLDGDQALVDGWLELQSGGGPSGSGLRLQLDLLNSRQDGDNIAQFRLNQSRVVNPGEIQYFDHPAFGVLVRVDALDDGY